MPKNHSALKSNISGASLELSGALKLFIENNSLSVLRPISKGWTSIIYLAENNAKQKFALKVLREKSNRTDMVKRETENLALANSVGVGPKWVKSDSESNVVVMRFVEGSSFGEWLFSGISKKQLSKFIELLYAQVEALDKIGLDHGQLAGRGKNILVSKGKPVIIDFEKASSKRKVHNVKVLDSFLFRSKNSAVVKKVEEILEG